MELTLGIWFLCGGAALVIYAIILFWGKQFITLGDIFWGLVIFTVGLIGLIITVIMGIFALAIAMDDIIIFKRKQ